MSSEPADQPFRELLGDTSVLSAEQVLESYPVDTSDYQSRVMGALLPKSADLIPAILRIANHFQTPIYTISTGRNWGYGGAQPTADKGWLLDLSLLTEISVLDAAVGLVRLEPGVTQKQLADFLDANHLDFMVPTTGAGPNVSLVGNALEKGFGLTPYEDHFGAVTRIEALLADGSFFPSALSEMGAPEADGIFKWGLGPYLDGLLAQGNIAVVTAMTLALAPRPESAEAFYFYVSEAEQLEQAVICVRKMLQRLPGILSSVNLMNQHRQLSMLAEFPAEYVGKDASVPLEKIDAMALQRNLPAWLGYGHLYGAPSIVRAAKKLVRSELSQLRGKIIFVNRRKVTIAKKLLAWMPKNIRTAWEFKLDATLSALNMVEGRPTIVALPLAYWRSGTKPAVAEQMNPAKDGCGLIWYAPILSLNPKSVSVLTELVYKSCAEFAIEPLITLTLLSPRQMVCTVPILFDRQDANMAARAKALYDALFERGRSQGFLPYRLGADKMHYLRDHAPVYTALCEKLKLALDPNHILSPGRYNAEKR